MVCLTGVIPVKEETPPSSIPGGSDSIKLVSTIEKLHCFLVKKVINKKKKKKKLIAVTIQSESKLYTVHLYS